MGASVEFSRCRGPVKSLDRDTATGFRVAQVSRKIKDFSFSLKTKKLRIYERWLKKKTYLSLM